MGVTVTSGRAQTTGWWHSPALAAERASGEFDRCDRSESCGQLSGSTSYPQVEHLTVSRSVIGGHHSEMKTPRPWPLPQQPTSLKLLIRPGVSDEMVRTQLRSGRLLRLRPRVYLAAEAWPEDPEAQQIVLARAEQVAFPDAVISHGSAALIWGLPTPGAKRWQESPPTLTLPRGGGYRTDTRSARHVLAALPAHHLTRDPAGYTVTTVARTAVDLARGLDLPEALVLLDAAARRIGESIVTRPHREYYASPAVRAMARELLTEAAQVRRFASLRRAIDLTDPRRESPIESLAAGHFVLAGLPMPEFQVRIRTAIGVFYVDCYWPEQRLIGEADGAIKYVGPRSMVDEKIREQALRDTDRGMVRWLGTEIHATPWVVTDRVARALDLGWISR